MEAEGVWRLVRSYPSVFDHRDVIFQYELRTSTEYGDALYSSSNKDWHTSIISMCGFCLDGEWCGFHPDAAAQDEAEVAAGAVVDVPPKLRPVPPEHMGKPAREAARAEPAPDGYRWEWED